MVVGPRYKGAPKIMMKNSFRIFLACCTTLFIVLIYSTPPSTALAPSSGFDANGNGRDIDTEAWEKETNSSPAAKGGSYQPHSSNNNHQPISESKRLNARPGFALSDHCEHPLSSGRTFTSCRLSGGVAISCLPTKRGQSLPRL